MKNSNAELLPPGSVIVCTRATIGEAAINTVPMATNQGFKSIIPTQDVDSDFLYYLVRSLKREFVRRAAGSTFLEISASSFAKIPVRIPDSLEVQRWLVRPLILLDDIAIALQDLIAAKREFKRGLMQELLTGRRRFPEFQHDPRPTVALGEVTIINPDTLPESTDDYFRFRYIDISSVSEGRVTIPVSAIAFRDAPSRARRIVRQYDVLFSTVRPYLKGFAIVEDDRRDLVCSTGFAVLRAATKADAQYLLEVLFSDVVGRQVHARLVGSSFPALNSDDVANIRIPWPSAPERAKISHVLRAIRREIHLLEEMRARFETAKRGLMQKLLTGELTVPVSSEPEPVHA